MSDEFSGATRIDGEFEGGVRLKPALRETTSTLNRFAQGMLDPIQGIGQLVGQRLTDENGQDIGSMDDLINQQSKDYVAPEGIDWARMGGNLANPVTWQGGGGTKAAQAAWSAIKQGARIGLAQAAAMPVENSDNFWGSKAAQIGTGAVLGGGLTGLGRAGGGVYDFIMERTGGPVVQAARKVKGLIEDRAAGVVQQLRDLKPLIQGEMPTSDLVPDAGLTRLARDTISGPNAELWRQRELVNKAAGTKVLDDIIEPNIKPMDANGNLLESPAEALRTTQSAPAYEVLRSRKDIYVPPDLRRVLGAPEVSPAAGAGRGAFMTNEANIGASGGIPEAISSGGGRTVPASAGRDTLIGTDGLMHFRDTSKIDNIGEIVPNQANILPMENVASLMEQKKALGSRIRKAKISTDEGSDALARDLTLAKGNLTNWLYQADPATRWADESFRAYSPPINRANFASAVKDKYLGSTNEEHLAAALSALRNPETTAKAAGLSNVETLTKAMGPHTDALTNMQNLDQFLQRRLDASNRIYPNRSAGEYMDPAKEVAGATPSILSRPISFGKKAIEWLGRGNPKKIQTEIDRAVLDPQYMINLLEQGSPQERHALINALRGAIDDYGGPAMGLMNTQTARSIGER
jgi:hypothetical protein